jgi:exonuclease III
MRFGSWNVRSLYRAASLTTVARELARYKLDFVCVQVVRWGKGDMEKADYIFIYGHEMKINCGQDFFTPQNSISSSESSLVIG